MESNDRKDYAPPMTRCVPLALEDALCGSSVPGGNEDIGYDDWD